MEKKSKVNWWVLLAIAVIGVPVGFVGMGFFNRVGENDSTVIPEVQAKVHNDNSNPHSDVGKTDSVIPFSDEQKRPVDSEPASPKTETEAILGEKKAEKKTEIKSEEVQDEQIKIVKEEQKKISREEIETKAREKKEAEERKKAEMEEKKRQKETEKKLKEQEELKNKQNELKNKVQKQVAFGYKNDIVPDGCVIVVNNGQSMDYQSFRNGVKLGSFSNISVNNVESNANGTAATKVYVTARVATD